MQRIHNFDKQQKNSSYSSEAKRWLPKFSKERFSRSFSRILIPLILLTGGTGLAAAQENTEATAVAESWTIYVVTNPIRLRQEPNLEGGIIRMLEAGEQVNVSEIDYNGAAGYDWATVVDGEGRVVGYFAISGNNTESAVVLTPEAGAAPEAPTEVPTDAPTSPEPSETATPLATVSPTDIPPVVTPDTLRTQSAETVQRIIERGSVDVSSILVPQGFSFGVDSIRVYQAESGSTAIRDGIEGQGRPWIEGALSLLGYSPDYIQNYFDSGEAGLYMMGDAAIDRYLRDVRLGSWGTTMYVFEGATPTLVPAFHSTAFANAQYGNIILRDTAVEEAVQGVLYKNMFELQAMYPSYFEYWGFPDQNSMVESLSQNGHLRAFLEYAQHAAIQSNHTGWNNDSYTHRIGTSEIGGTFGLRQEFINLVNTVMGTNYTTLPEVLPYFADQQKLLELNFEFRQWSQSNLGRELNVWDAFGLYRDGGVSIQPLVDWNF